jgi:hypothetical protein
MIVAKLFAAASATVLIYVAGKNIKHHYPHDAAMQISLALIIIIVGGMA